MDISLQCVNCKSTGPFSNRQRKRGPNSARCQACIAAAEKANAVHPARAAIASSTETYSKYFSKGAPSNSNVDPQSKNTVKRQRSNDDTDDTSSSPKNSTTSSSSSDSSTTSSSSSSSSSSNKNNDNNNCRTQIDKRNYLLEKIPRRKVPETNLNADGERSENCNNTDDGEDAESPVNVSLNALKERILGRKLIASADIADENTSVSLQDCMSPVGKNKDLSSPIPTESLRRDLACAICHETLYQPVSLLCGHSFCKPCLHWWFFLRDDHSNRTCPTCRRAVENVENSSYLCVNVALRACIETLFRNEMISRRQAEELALKKATAGENEGFHDCGYATISSIDDESWTTIRGETKRSGAIKARRSIVMDAHDQRMQLALAFRGGTDCSPLRWLGSDMEVILCLLTMEEDEAADSGFPLILESDDDEHLLTREERFCSPVEVTAWITNPNGVVTCSNFPVCRRVMGIEGVVEFHINTSTPELSQTSILSFLHKETGTVLQIDLPQSRPGQSKITMSDDVNDDDVVDLQATYRSNNLAEEQYDDDSEINEYEDDGFIVADDSEDENEDMDDDEDVCCICRDGGHMIVCDGGENVSGCGCYFHLECIGRDVVPPGDWICKGCANQFGLTNVGTEGHEFQVSTTQDSISKKVPRKKLRKIQYDSSASHDFASDDEELVGSFSPLTNEQENLSEQSEQSSPEKVSHKRRPKRSRVIESDEDD